MLIFPRSTIKLSCHVNRNVSKSVIQCQIARLARLGAAVQMDWPGPGRKGRDVEPLEQVGPQEMQAHNYGDELMWLGLL